jgi:asparagine synthase (glutamine-hydrolysing)
LKKNIKEGRGKMCGFCGTIGGGPREERRKLVEKMNKVIAHRGPDEFGYYHDDFISLGHRRLSIIDLKTGTQPISNEQGNIWIVYNGEIYNFLELRQNLVNKHYFKTNTDTEVIVHLYEERGIDCFAKLDGMFSFALWDKKQRKLFLVRDNFGIKPLHYYYDGKRLVFCSEIKGILQDKKIKREVDFQALHYFLNVRYIPGERTLLKNIYRLPPAHYLLFQPGKMVIRKYWSLKIKKAGAKKESYYQEGIREHLRRAIKKQLISDVPVGVYLSGGMDSSSVVALMSSIVREPFKVFTLGFNEPTDEFEDARRIARQFNVSHYEKLLPLSPLKNFPEVIWYVEEPKVNILQGFLLAKFAKEKVKVILGGLGGDELFAGYEIYQYINPSLIFHKIVPEYFSKTIFQNISNFIFNFQNTTGTLRFDEYRKGLQMLLSVGNPLRYYLILRNCWDYDKKAYENIYSQDLLKENLQPTFLQFEKYFSNKSSPLEEVLWAEFNTKMVNDFLLLEDRVSMANGLEVRVPFLDRELVEFAFSIPTSLKIKNNCPKYIFRKTMKGILPSKTITKKKWGFTFNPYFQFKKDLKKTAEEVLTKKRIEKQGFFNYGYIKKIIEYPPHPKLRWHYFMLWKLVGFQYWYEMFIKGKSWQEVNEILEEEKVGSKK